jgi:hypothetical protein
MTVIITAVLFIVALSILALQANARFRRETRLPMQWWINGDVTWSAPRHVALGLMPALALPMFATLVFLPPRAGQDGDVLPATFAMGATMIAAQLFHFWLIGKTLARNGS